jgi:tRNA threonylcarbamoyladenosine dehydratase
MSVNAAQSPHAQRFAGIGRLYGVAAMNHLARARVLVVGVGGVGSWTAEALARTGVGHLTLMDLDEVCVSNINRQLPALDGTIGLPKVQVLAERARRINPACEVVADQRFFTDRTADSVFSQRFDVVIDAIDTHRHKVLLIAECRRRAVPLVVAGGAGGRRDPTRVRTKDLSKTTNDALLRNIRRDLRRLHGFPADGPWQVPAVFSEERPVYPHPDGTVCETSPEQAPTRLDCATGYGTAAFVTGTFGFALAAAAVELVIAASANTVSSSG